MVPRHRRKAVISLKSSELYSMVMAAAALALADAATPHARGEELVAGAAQSGAKRHETAEVLHATARCNLQVSARSLPSAHTHRHDEDEGRWGAGGRGENTM